LIKEKTNSRISPGSLGANRINFAVKNGFFTPQLPRYGFLYLAYKV